MTTRIYSIGHSILPIADFIRLLAENQIEIVVDVRRFPGSRRHPQYSSDTFRSLLAASAVDYLHLPSLGGRRKPRPDSVNLAWRNDSFRAYADHMASDEFREGVQRLLALGEVAALVCAEAVPWRCHRNLISDELTRRGLEVVHILGPRSLRPHVLNPAARDAGDHLIYPGEASQMALL